MFKMKLTHLSLARTLQGHVTSQVAPCNNVMHDMHQVVHVQVVHDTHDVFVIT